MTWLARADHAVAFVARGVHAALLLPSQYPGNKNAAFCTHCKSTLSVAHSGNDDIKDYIKMVIHKQRLQAGSSTVAANHLKRAAQEGTFVYHLVKHNQRFWSMDCTAGLVCYKVIIQFSNVFWWILGDKTIFLLLSTVELCISKNLMIRIVIQGWQFNILWYCKQSDILWFFQFN